MHRCTEIALNSSNKFIQNPICPICRNENKGGRLVQKTAITSQKYFLCKDLLVVFFNWFIGWNKHTCPDHIVFLQMCFYCWYKNICWNKKKIYAVAILEVSETYGDTVCVHITPICPHASFAFSGFCLFFVCWFSGLIWMYTHCSV